MKNPADGELTVRARCLRVLRTGGVVLVRGGVLSAAMAVHSPLKQGMQIDIFSRPQTKREE